MRSLQDKERIHRLIVLCAIVAVLTYLAISSLLGAFRG